MKLELLEEIFVSRRISKDFVIEIDTDKTITINKWDFQNTDGSDEWDWDIVEGQKIYDEMSEEEQDEFYDFIVDRCML